jgi:organic radical activating enzyme
MLIAKMPDGTPEIYPAFQGEGSTISKHCVFVRLAGCNLSCNFCDTSYSWLWEGRKEDHRYSKPVKQCDYVMQMTPEEVAQKIRDALNPSRRVVFTGGEPLMQQKDILKVILEYQKLTGLRINVEIETNGTIEINKDLAKYVNIINCSPKLASSGNSKSKRNNAKAIESLVTQGLYTECFFKFVVHHDNLEKDMKEIKEWQKEHAIYDHQIYLMPEGVTEERIKEASPVVWEYAYKHGYKFSPRLQVMLFGNKRAV